MQIYKAAKLLKMPNKELIKLIDRPEVDHHMDKIPDELLEGLGLVEKKINTTEQEPTETVDLAETIIVEEKLEEIKLPKGVTPAQVWHACTGVGTRHKLWKYKHLGIKPEK